MKVLCVFGTRPEAIKMAPVVLALRRRRVPTVACATAQHRELMDAALRPFGLAPDHDLDLMRPNQTLESLTARVLQGIDGILLREKPDLVLVQGDTTTAFASALAAFYRRVPVGHVEAGLRTGDLAHPFPEEANRVLLSRLAALHFAPTRLAARNLRSEGLREGIHVSGNTVVDALQVIARGLRGPTHPSLARWASNGPLLLVTAHRRENFGAPMEAICRAVHRLLDAHPSLRAVVPVHPNPSVQEVMHRRLEHPRALLTKPLPYEDLLWLLRRSRLVLTDSGGIQEEAPSFGVPVCVLRKATERPEAVRAGAALIAGTEEKDVFRKAHRLLSSPAAHARMAKARHPFGDGKAGDRIARAVLHFFGRGPRPEDWKGG